MGNHWESQFFEWNSVHKDSSEVQKHSYEVGDKKGRRVLNQTIKEGRRVCLVV